MTTFALLLNFAAGPASPPPAIHLAPTAFQSLGRPAGPAAQAADALTRAIMSVSKGVIGPSDRARLLLSGTVWSTEDEGAGRGSFLVSWQIASREGTILGRWAAKAASFRELISSMPGSGLEHPNGLAGEILARSRSIIRDRELAPLRTLRLELFDRATGRPAPAEGLSLEESRPLRVTVRPPSDGVVVLLFVLGTDLVKAEARPARRGVRTTFPSDWNPVFGQRLVLLLLPSPESAPLWSAPVSLAPQLPLGMHESLRNEGILYALRLAQDRGPITAWTSL